MRNTVIRLRLWRWLAMGIASCLVIFGMAVAVYAQTAYEMSQNAANDTYSLSNAAGGGLTILDLTKVLHPPFRQVPQQKLMFSSHLGYDRAGHRLPVVDVGAKPRLANRGRLGARGPRTSRGGATDGGRRA